MGVGGREQSQPRSMPGGSEGAHLAQGLTASRTQSLSSLPLCDHTLNRARESGGKSWKESDI